ncbi:MAG TPA: sulfatase-like hydrolase/transferase [Gaiellaceae bacterium]|nr:sulfatase-like hydrolase/transferase [Gaiellaceae bacterium]
MPFFRPRQPTVDAGFNLVLITYDSCRYDVLAAAHTPVLDSYARIVPAQTPANFTYAAHHAFFAGMLPNAPDDLPYYNRFVRQVVRLGLRAEMTRPALLVVESDRNVVAGLRDAGWQTLGTGAMDWFQQRLLVDGFDRFHYTNEGAAAQIAWLLGALDRRRRFFAFLNFGETHTPFAYPGKPEAAQEDWSPRRMTWPPAEHGPAGREHPAWELQRGAAEYLDGQLATLFDGLPGETLVVLCADHGEAMGEDGYEGHGVNHETVLTVPLAIFRLDREPLPG